MIEPRWMLAAFEVCFREAVEGKFSHSILSCSSATSCQLVSLGLSIHGRIKVFIIRPIKNLMLQCAILCRIQYTCSLLSCHPPARNPIGYKRNSNDAKASEIGNKSASSSLRLRGGYLGKRSNAVGILLFLLAKWHQMEQSPKMAKSGI